MIKFVCPRCRAKIKAKDEVMGKEITCPKCRHRFPVGLTADAATAVNNAPIGEGTTPPITKALSPFRKWVAAHPLASAGIAGTVILIFVASIAGIYFAQSDKSQRGTILSDETQIGTISPDRLRDLARSAGMKVTDMAGQTFFIAENPGLYLRCTWKPKGNAQRITNIFICNTEAKHGPEGQRPVLDLWRQICPSLAEKMEVRFAQPRAQSFGWVWIGKSPYTYGIDWNNKAFVTFVGPQSEIPKRRTAAIAAANVRISWYRYILASRKRLVAKLRAPATAKQVSEEVSKAMSELEQNFCRSMVLLSCRSGSSVDYAARQQVPADPLSPLSVPDDLPTATRILLHRTAAEITGIARLTRFTVIRGDKPTFKAYDHMVMAFSEYPGVVRSAWGDYVKVEGLHETSKQLPPEQQKVLEEISLHGLSCLRAILPKN